MQHFEITCQAEDFETLRLVPDFETLCLTCDFKTDRPWMHLEMQVH